MTKKFFVAVCMVGGFVLSAHAQIEFFTDRASFNEACSGTVSEDFEDISGPLDGIDLVPGPTVDSMSLTGPIMPGDIEEGIEFTVTDNSGDGLLDMIVLSTFGGNPVGVPSAIFGTNTFLDSLRINFPGGADCVGFDTYSFANNPGMVDVTFMNGKTVLGTVTTGADISAAFTGAMTSGSDVITSIVFENEIDVAGGASLGELVDDVSFRLADKSCIVGDLNGDGVVTLLDVDGFVAAVQTQTFSCEADINGDGVVSLLDVDPFVLLVQGG